MSLQETKYSIFDHMKKSILIFPLVFLSLIGARSQGLDLQPVVGFQIWSTLSAGTEYIEQGTNNLRGVDGRWGFQLHRSRLGVKGSVNDRLKFAFIAANDFVGKDIFDGTIGAPNNTASPRFRLWDAYLIYDLDQGSDLFNLKLGYIVPVVSRESITSPFKVFTMEKSWSQNYIRRHMTNNGPGRTVGFNIGGLKVWEDSFITFGYDIGAYNAKLGDFDSNSAGRKSSNLIAGRTTVHFGDPEMKTYGQGIQQLIFDKRRGVTIGLSQAIQGETDFYDNNSLTGADLLFHWDNISIVGEWAMLKRTLDNQDIDAEVFFIRAGYLIPLAASKYVSMAISHTSFVGVDTPNEVAQANVMRTFSGTDRYTEITLSYFMSKKNRLLLSYTLRNGDNGSAMETAINNNYFQQSGFTFERPSYFGIGWHVTI